MDREAMSKLGANIVDGGSTRVRVWAPRCSTVEVVCQAREGAQAKGTSFPLTDVGEGYFEGTLAELAAGSKYWIRLDGKLDRPDPVSRYQPEGVHGPSEVIDWQAFPWRDQAWRGLDRDALVIYELHLGAFTEAGTFAAAIDRLDELLDLGVTAIELMPVADSPGRWNWGYDGVDLFAVRRTYGTPDDFRRFVDACHQRGLAVILDVVYNHLGPEGNYLADFGPYFTRRHRTPWGEAVNFDGRLCQPVREFFVENALRWLREYHLDGLRLDAVHFMFDDSPTSILSELGQAVRVLQDEEGRKLHLIAEANVYDESLVAKKSGYSAIWCDDIMHSIYSHVSSVNVTHREYRGGEDLADALRHGYLYLGAQSVRAEPQDRSRIQSSQGVERLAALVVALQTHDSVGNHPHGLRLRQLTSVPTQRAACPLILLYPAIPMLFMGEESESAPPFPFFVDFEDEQLRKAVVRGRRREYSHQAWKGAVLPTDPQAFYSAKYPRPPQADRLWNWYRNLLALRRSWRQQGWLQPGHLQVEVSHQYQLFNLKYVDRDNLKGQVIAWLPRHREGAEQALIHWTLPETGRICLDSLEGNAPYESGSTVTLRHDEPRALIWEST